MSWIQIAILFGVFTINGLVLHALTIAWVKSLAPCPTSRKEKTSPRKGVVGSPGKGVVRKAGGAP
jgi:hypothetical protein